MYAKQLLRVSYVDPQIPLSLLPQQPTENDQNGMESGQDAAMGDFAMQQGGDKIEDFY